MNAAPERANWILCTPFRPGLINFGRSIDLTLCLAVLSKNLCIVCADRRISGRASLSDEHNKTIVLVSADARVVLTFTGLATAGRFAAARWLMQTLTELGAPDFTLAGIIERLRVKLTDEFARNLAIRAASAPERRFTLMLAGYLYIPGRPGMVRAHPISALLSNFEGFDGQQSYEAREEFGLYINGAAPSDVVTLAIGNTVTLKPDDADRMRRAALSTSPKAIARKLVDIIRKAAPHVRSIGEQISSVLLSPDPEQPVTCDYHSAKPRSAFETPATVHVTPHQQFFASLKLTPTDPEEILSLRQVARDAPCPCGSGRKFKLCHGRKPGVSMKVKF